MVYAQTLIDNFDDNVFDEAKWTVTQGRGSTESGGKLNLACIADYPRVEGDILFDLSTGILAAKLSVTGTRASNTEFYIGAHDASGNHISALGGPNGSYITFQPGGLATFSNEVVTDETVGVGPAWVAGAWWGIGNMGSDNVVRMYNSTDGQTWNEMARCTVGGTFNKTAVGMVFMAGVWDGSTPSLVANFDDASFWAVQATGDSFRPVKVRTGGSWKLGVPKARVGGVWVPAYSKPRFENTWSALN